MVFGKAFFGDVDVDEVDEDFGEVAGVVLWEGLVEKAEGRVSRSFCEMEGQEKGLTNSSY